MDHLIVAAAFLALFCAFVHSRAFFPTQSQAVISSSKPDVSRGDISFGKYWKKDSLGKMSSAVIIRRSKFVVESESPWQTRNNVNENDSTLRRLARQSYDSKDSYYRRHQKYDEPQAVRDRPKRKSASNILLVALAVVIVVLILTVGIVIYVYFYYHPESEIEALMEELRLREPPYNSQNAPTVKSIAPTQRDEEEE